MEDLLLPTMSSVFITGLQVLLGVFTTRLCFFNGGIVAILVLPNDLLGIGRKRRVGSGLCGTALICELFCRRSVPKGVRERLYHTGILSRVPISRGPRKIDT